MAKDPVCGMNVNEKQATTAAHGGKTYYFCSRCCSWECGEEPDRFVPAPAGVRSASEVG